MFCWYPGPLPQLEFGGKKVIVYVATLPHKFFPGRLCPLLTVLRETHPAFFWTGATPLVVRSAYPRFWIGRHNSVGSSAYPEIQDRCRCRPFVCCDHSFTFLTLLKVGWSERKCCFLVFNSWFVEVMEANLAFF